MPIVSCKRYLTELTVWKDFFYQIVSQLSQLLQSCQFILVLTPKNSVYGDLMSTVYYVLHIHRHMNIDDIWKSMQNYVLNYIYTNIQLTSKPMTPNAINLYETADQIYNSNYFILRSL